MNSQLEEKLKKLPRSSGVYFHKSESGEVIYVGKAAVLKNRVRQYFQDSRGRDNKTMALVAEIYDTDWIETESEVDALFLESEMIKRYMPRYNVLLRDDKSQMYVRINMKSEWPIVTFTRNPIDDGAEYFGPFYNGFALKKALRYLRKVFPYLTHERRPGQSQLDEDIGLSPKLSEGPEVYKANLKKLISYIKGNRKIITSELEQDMKLAAKRQEFEKAAILRNKLRYMNELQRRVMFGDKEFLDISKDRALADLTQLLGLKDIPVRIEGYDISHHGGSNVVASMVVFSNGVSDRAEYRKFKVDEKNDDVDNIKQAVYRRLSPRNLKSWGEPDIILIDGGKGQLNGAIEARDERDLGHIPIISVAKREEELIIHQTKSSVGVNYINQLITKPTDGVCVFKDGDFYIVNLHTHQINASSHSRNLRASTGAPGRYDDIVKLVQRIRDESHRFAVSYHTVLKRKQQTKSLLDDIPGVGPATKRKLIKSFGSTGAVLKASEQDLAKVIGEARAKNMFIYIKRESNEK